MRISRRVWAAEKRLVVGVVTVKVMEVEGVVPVKVALLMGVEEGGMDVGESGMLMEVEEGEMLVKVVFERRVGME